jgi:hypothetical protein
MQEMRMTKTKTTMKRWMEHEMANPVGKHQLLTLRCSFTSRPGAEASIAAVLRSAPNMMSRLCPRAIE